MLVEGPVLLGAALDARAELIDVFVDEATQYDHQNAAVLRRLPDHVDPWVLPAGTLDRVGDAATSQGIAAVVSRPEVAWPTPDQGAFVVVLAEVGDPGNAGTLMRAAAASGAAAVIAAGGVDPTHPKVVRASAGTMFSLDVVSAGSVAEALDRLRTAGFALVGTVAREGDDYDGVDLSGPVAVVLGNEAHGLPDPVMAELDLAVTIPMPGPAESLNVAMAGTVICFEVLRQRRGLGQDGPAGTRTRPPGEG